MSNYEKAKKAISGLVNAMVATNTVPNYTAQRGSEQSGKTTSATQTGANTATAPKSFASGDDYIKSRIEALGLNRDRIDAKGFSKWVDDAYSAMEEMLNHNKANADKYDPNYGGEAGERVKNLLNSSGDVSRYLKNHKDEFENYEELEEMISQLRSNLISLDKANYDTRRYYSQFGSEEGYKNHLDTIKYGEMSTEELEAEHRKYKDAYETDLALDIREAESNLAWSKNNAMSPTDYSAQEAYVNDLKSKFKEQYGFEWDNASQNNPTLYYDQHGAVTLKNLITVKKAEGKLADIQSDDTLNSAYGEMKTYLSDVKQMEGATAYSSLIAEGFSDEEIAQVYPEYKSAYDYVVSKYGKEYSLEANHGNPSALNDALYTLIQEVDGGYHIGQQSPKEVLSQAGYDWEELRYYEDWKADRDESLRLRESYKKSAEQFTGLQKLVSMTLAPIGQVFEYVGDVAGMTRAAGKDEFSAYGLTNIYDNNAGTFINATNEVVSAKIEKAVLDATGSETWAKFVSTIEGGVSSAIQSAATTAASVAMFGPKAGAVVSLGVMSSQAASSQFTTAISNGSTAGQALVSSVAAGAAEAIFEKVSLEGLMKIGSSLDYSSFRAYMKSLLMGTKDVALQGVAEMSEEFFTTIANRFTDDVINGDHSSYNTAVDRYMRAGLSEGDAQKQASMDWGQELLSSAIGGFFGGIASGGAATAVRSGLGAIATASNVSDRNKAYNDVYGADAAALIEEALAADPENKLALKLKKDVENGKKISGANVAKLVGQSEAGIVKGDTSAIKAAAAQRLTELGETGDVDAISDAISKHAAGAELTARENWLVRNSQYGAQVDSELKSGADWVKNIETGSINIDEYSRIVAESQINPANIDSTDTINADKNAEIAPETAKSAEPKTTFPVNVLADNSPESVAKAIAAQQANEDADAEGPIRSSITLESAAAASIAPKALYTSVYNMAPNTDVAKFDDAFRKAYEWGQTGAVPIEYAMKSPLTKALTEAQREAAYKAGSEAREALAQHRDLKMKTGAAVKKASPSQIKNGRKKGVVKSEGVKMSDLKETFNDPQNQAYRMLSFIAEATGKDIILVKSTLGKDGQYRLSDNEDYQGKFSWGEDVIRIDINAGLLYGADANYLSKYTMLRTFTHEFVHTIERDNATGYEELREAVFAELRARGEDVDALIRAKEDNGLSYDDASREVVAEALSDILRDSHFIENLVNNHKSLAERLLDKLKEFINNLRDYFNELKKNPNPDRGARALQDNIEGTLRYAENIIEVFDRVALQSVENYQAAAVAEVVQDQQMLAEAGIGLDVENHEAYALRHSPAYTDVIKVGKKDFDVEGIAKAVAKGTGRSYEDSLKWVQSEMAIANIIMGNPEFLDFEPDSRYEAIKKNSDYPQGTVDLSNLCPKRTEFTAMFDMLQKKYPNKLFTASDVAEMRSILKKNDITVACGACFVEDRRQLLGEIADTYIGMWKEAVETGKPLQKTNAAGNKVTLNVTKALAKQYGLTAGAQILAADKYIPTQYDLTTYEGFKLLEKNHPTIALGFIRYNNSRGQQAGRLIEGRAEYNRQILGWSEAKVKNVNNNGGLRIFSFSDFEVVHLLDLVQVIIDCAAMGVKIQGYTKIPAFSRLIRDTGIKINRSLIPKGQTGMKMVDGKQVLDYDTTEGIDINDENFLDEKDNPNVGNIIIGINPTQIGIAMLDDFIDYIIPFHTNKSKDICKALGLAEWVNYKESQHEKDIATGKASKHNVNIYTQVINKYHPTNKVEFVNAFLKECKRQGKIPRYSEFLNVDENGDFTYREGYHKLLVDFKMFDSEGNILPQGEITPNLDDAFMADLLKAEVDKKQSYEFPQEVYDQIEEQFGDDTSDGSRYQYMSRDVLENVDPPSREESKTIDMLDIRNLARYYSEVYSAFDGKLPSGQMLLVGKTPDLLVKYGASDGPLYLPQRAIKKNKPGEKHGLGEAVIYGLPEELHDPLAITGQTTKHVEQGDDGIVVWTNWKDAEENSVVVPIRVDPVNFLGEKANIATTVFDLNTEEYFDDLLREGNIKYTKNNESIPQLLSQRRYVPKAMASSAFNRIMKEYSEFVKSKSKIPSSDTDIEQHQPRSNLRQPAPVFYSKMARVVDGMKQEKFGASSVISMLTDPKRGVKAEEIKWSGIEEFLEGKKSVTKAELQEFITGSQLQIEETVKYKVKADNVQIKKMPDKKLGVYVDGKLVDAFERVEDEGGYLLHRIGTSISPDNMYTDKQSLLETYGDIYGNAVKWDDHKLKGGRNYREIVLKMSKSTYSNFAMKAHWGEATGGVLAHARIQDFNAKNGKMLFIEEIQSDWHNAGKSQGYESDRKRYLNDQKYREKLHKDAQDYRRQKAELEYDINNATRLTEEQRQDLVDKRDKLDILMLKIENITSGKNLAPDAPFSDTYHEYVLKRLLRMAAEEGYDSIGWTTADIQSKRWSDEYAEGYRIEYDQDIPGFLRRYGKKWGASVDKTTLRNGNEVWSMPITEAMKESVIYEGQEQYQSRDYLQKRDADYLDAVNRGDMETAQRMVNEAAKMAGYITTYRYHQTDRRFTVFSNGNPVAGLNDSDTPNGYFFKENDHDIGVGGDYVKTGHGGNIQMRVFLKHSNMLHFENREAAAKWYTENVPGYADLLAKYNKHLSDFEQISKENNDKMFDELMQLDKAGKSTTAADLAIMDKYDKIIDAWIEDTKDYSDGLRADMRNLLNKYFIENDSGYDGIEIDDDGHRYIDMKREDVHTYIVFKNTQVKSADPVTYDDKGNVIPLSQRFNMENEDIRYQERTRSISDRQLLQMAASEIDIEGLTEGEKEALRIFNERLAKLSKLQEERSAQWKSFFQQKNKDKAEATKTRNRIKVLDDQIKKANDAVLDVEEKSVLRSVLKKAREIIEAQDKEQFDAKIKRIRERRNNSTQIRDYRERIRRTIRALDKVLNKGNKKQNVKEGMQEFVSKALKSADVLFTDEYNDEDMIRNGVGTQMTEKEAKQMEVAKQVLAEIDGLRSQLANMTDAAAMLPIQNKLEELKPKLDYRRSQLRDVFARERTRINSAPADQLLADLAREYKKLQESEYGYIAGAYQESVYEFLNNLQQNLESKVVSDMTAPELAELYSAYTMVLTTVRDANKAFAADIKETIEQLGNRTMFEVHKEGKDVKKRTKASQAVSSFSWNNTKPIYAFERIGSSTLTRLYNNIANGENVYAVDVEAAKDFVLKTKKKHGYTAWDLEKTYEFTSSSGMTFKLNLSQIMSIYAYSKREAAHDHLTKGGFVFSDKTEVIVNKLGIPVTYLNEDATAYNVSDELVAEIVSDKYMTKEQRDFVDEMQDYLSNVVGENGNEVSMKLFGVKLFGEEHYFPLRSSGAYLTKAKEAELKKEQGQISLVNSGFTKATTPKASNPIVLEGFMDVWSDHVNDMSLYHAFVLPLEDFRRVYNYNSPHVEEGKSMSVDSAVRNAQGRAASQYIDQLLRDVNGGTVADPREGLIKTGVSNFKKASVVASMSVVVQQPTAMFRAMAYIDRKYFGVSPMVTGVGRALGNVFTKAHTKAWEEVKTYAPGVAIIKEIGGFDTSTGQSITDYLSTNEYEKGKLKALFKDKRYGRAKIDEALGKLPAMADELAWVEIWNAVKRETKARNKGMDVTSEEFLKIAGERFTEVIRKTQVYDSVFTKSSYMRSKGATMAMLTSFMAEPTTTINMVEDALRKLAKGNWKHATRVAASVGASIIINNILRSIVYAMRDDDDDETLLEKYIESLVGGLRDDANALNYFPVLRDVWSLMQGYDVERTDMTFIGKIVDVISHMVGLIAKDTEDMDEDEIKERDKAIGVAAWDLFASLASIFGWPVKNIGREVMGVINTIDTIASGQKSTSTSVWDSVKEAVYNSLPVFMRHEMPSDREKLYNAIMKGDTVYVERLKNGYSSDESYHAAVRRALRKGDPRIKEAAEARLNGNFSRYKELFYEIKNEGNFIFDDIGAAIDAEFRALEEEKTGYEAPERENKAASVFNVDDYYAAIIGGKTAEADKIRADLIAEKKGEGYLTHEAESSIESSFTSKVKEGYMDGDLNFSRASTLLTQYGGKETSEEANSEVKKWDFEMEYGYSWGARARGYRLGYISKNALMEAVMDVEGSDYEEASAYIRFLDVEKSNENIDITASDASGYYKYAEPAGISINVYLDYKDRTSGLTSDKDANGKTISGSKKAKVLATIDSLPITSAQKDALYYANGYKQSTIHEAPWR